MKRIKYILPAIAVCIGTSLSAQSYYDGARLIPYDLNGTARFVGMGGAMGALGGDISVMGTNPAGIGIFRSNDASVSLGFSNFDTKAKFDGTKSSADKTKFSFDNAGFVMAIKQGDYTPLRYVNFGFNMRKVANFDRTLSTGGAYNYSQTMQFANMVNDNSNVYGFLEPDILTDRDVFSFDDVPWLGALAYQSNLILLNNAGDGYWPYYDTNNHSGVRGDYYGREKGSIYSYDINMAFNLYDRVYLGATIGIYDVDYKRTSYYSETFLANDYLTSGKDYGEYTLENHYKLEGTGLDFKIGAIFRPIESSPLRIGVAVSTPIYYELTEYNMAYIGYETFNVFENDYQEGVVFPRNRNGNGMDGQTDYKVRTPWKYNFSLGYTVGSNLALGAEYEYQDYTSTSMKFDDGLKLYDENDMTKDYMKGVSTLRLGAEYRFLPEFSLRLGYNYMSAPISGNAYKELSLNSIRTDTEFANAKSLSNYTLGFGYRGKTFYADMAYKYQTQKADFYAFDIPEGGHRTTKVTNDRHQVITTFGVRF